MTPADRQAIRQMLRFQLQWDSEWSFKSEEEQWAEVDRIEKNDQLEWIAAWGGVKAARSRVEARRAADGRMIARRRMSTESKHSDVGQSFSSAETAPVRTVSAAVASAE